MTILQLTATDVRPPNQWKWRLHRLDDERKPVECLGDHAVSLNSNDWQYEAWLDLHRYVRRSTSSERRVEDERSILRDVGEWIGKNVFGGLRDKLVATASAEPTTVFVDVEDPGESAEIGAAQYHLIYRPLELAHIEAQPLSLCDICLVLSGRKREYPRVSAVAGEPVRMLAIFSLPSGASALNLREERYQLYQMMRGIKTRGFDLEFRILQYGVTREALRRILQDGRGWDIVHFTGHGLASGILLEKEDGSPDCVTTADLTKILRPARKNLRWVTLSSCLSAAATVHQTLRWLGIGTQTPESTDAPTTNDRATRAEQEMPVLAHAIAEKLDCAVLAMRFPVVDQFAIPFANGVYEGVIGRQQSLDRAVQLVIPEVMGDSNTGPSLPPISAVTPTLFGPRSAGLTVLPRKLEDSVASPSPFAWLQEPDRYFVGRVDELSRASQALASRSGSTGVLFYGMAGAGKSACARELAWLQEGVDRFRFCVWFKAPDSAHDLTPGLENFAKALQLQVPVIQMADEVKSREAFISYLPKLRDILRQNSILIVIDNVESLLTEPPQSRWRHHWANVIDALLSHDGESRVVLTSRLDVPIGDSDFSRAFPHLCPDNLDDRLVRISVNSLSLDEATIFAQQLPNLRAIFDGTDTANPDDRERHCALLRRMLNVVQGHPTLMGLANTMAADPDALGRLLDETSPNYSAPHADLGAFFESGKSELSTENFLATLNDWTLQVVQALPSSSQDLFKFLCCLEDCDRIDHIIVPTFEDVSAFLEREKQAAPEATEENQAPGEEAEGESLEDKFEQQLAETVKQHERGGAIVYDLVRDMISEAELTDEQRCHIEEYMKFSFNVLENIRATHSAFFESRQADVECLADSGLVTRHPATDERSEFTYQIHPCIAEIGRASVSKPFAEYTAARLARYWHTGYRLGYETELPTGGGVLLRDCAKKAIPYLFRAEEFDVLTRLLHHLVRRESSTEFYESLVPLTDEVVRDSIDTENELANRGLQAEILLTLGHYETAERNLRDLATVAESKGDFVAANTAQKCLVDLLRHNGRIDDALAALEQKRRLTERSNLGPLISVIDDGMLLQIRHHQGYHNEVLERAYGLLERLDGMDENDRGLYADVWQVREATLGVAYSAALALTRWKDALEFNRQVLLSREKRGATDIELFVCRFNDYAPLVHLGEHHEARKIVESCRKAFEKRGEVGLVGGCLSALAHIELHRKNTGQALRFAKTAIRYSYVDGSPDDCASSHLLLSNLLPPQEALSHRIAAAMIMWTTKDGDLPDVLGAIYSSLSELTSGFEDVPALAADGSGLEDVIRAVDEVEGVAFGSLVRRLSGGDASAARRTLAQVLVECKSVLESVAVGQAAHDMISQVEKRIGKRTSARDDDKGGKVLRELGDLLSSADVGGGADVLKRLTGNDIDQLSLSETPGDLQELRAWAMLVAGILPELSKSNLAEAEKCLERLIGLIEEDEWFLQMAFRALKNRADRHRIARHFDAAVTDYTRILELPGVTQDQIADALVSRGYCFSQMDCPDDAVKDYSAVLQLPDVETAMRGRALQNRGIRHREAGRYAEALKDFEETKTIPDRTTDDVGEVLLACGEIYRKQGQFEKAVEEFSQLLDYPEALPVHTVAAYRGRAAAHVELGDKTSAIHDLTKITEHSGASREDKLDALLTRANVQEVYEDLALAKQDVERAIRDCGDDALLGYQAFLARSNMALREGDSDAALHACERVLEVSQLPSEVKAEALVARAAVRNQRHEFDLAVADADEASTVSGKRVGRTLSDAYFQRGVANAGRSRLADAIADYTEVINSAATPANWVAESLVNRGATLLQTGDSKKAADDFTRAIELESGPVVQVHKGLVNRALCYMIERRYDEAVKDCNEVIEDPAARAEELADAFCNRGTVHAQADRHEDALADFDRVLEIPGAKGRARSVAMLQRGIVFAAREQTDDALREWSRAMDEEGRPQEVEFESRARRASTLCGADRTAEALDDIAALLAIDTTPADMAVELLVFRARHHIQGDDFQAAIDDATRACERQPSNMWLRTAVLIRGQSHLQLDQLDEAMRDFQSVEADAECPGRTRVEARIHMASIFNAREEYAEARSLANAVIQDESASAEVRAEGRFQRGVALDALGEPEAALDDFSAVAVDPDVADARRVLGQLSRAQILRQLDREAEAIDVLTELLEQPNVQPSIRTQALKERGRARFSVSDLDCVEDTQTVAEVAEAEGDWDEWAGSLLGIASVYIRTLEDERALELCERVLQRRDLDRRHTIEALLLRGVALQGLDRREEALADLTRVIASDDAPDHRRLQALHQRFETLFHLRRWDEAISDATELARIYDGDLDEILPVLVYGAVSTEADLDAVICVYTEMLDSPQLPPPFVFPARMGRGMAFLTAQLFDKALEDFDTAARMTDLTPVARASALFNRSCARGTLGDYEGAMEDCQEVLATEGTSNRCPARANLAIAYQHLERWEDVVEQARKILEEPDLEGPVEARAHMLIGEGLLRLAESGEEAAEVLQAAERLIRELDEEDYADFMQTSLEHIDKLRKEFRLEHESN